MEVPGWPGAMDERVAEMRRLPTVRRSRPVPNCRVPNSARRSRSPRVTAMRRDSGKTATAQANAERQVAGSIETCRFLRITTIIKAISPLIANASKSPRACPLDSGPPNMTTTPIRATPLATSVLVGVVARQRTRAQEGFPNGLPEPARSLGLSDRIRRSSVYLVRSQRPQRRIGALPATVLAVLVLFARLAGAASMPAASEADAVARAALHTICHTGPADDAGRHGPSHDGSHDRCLLCPSCHLATTAALPASTPALARPATVAVLRRAVLPPPATGPPHAVRLAARPTGPPAAI